MSGVTVGQMEKMLHCVGHKPFEGNYRNYYFTDENDKDWGFLFKNGYALKSFKNEVRTGIYYHLTNKGKELVKTFIEMYDR